MNNEGDEKKPIDKTKKKKAIKAALKWIGIFTVIILALIVLTYEGPWPFGEEKTETAELSPANVELYRFSDRAGGSHTNVTNESVTDDVLNVEIWLKNTGEDIARDISIFVRVRDQNGNIEFIDMLDLTWELLAENETCSTVYTVDYEPGDTFVEHTIEIRWDTGMNSYLKKTEL